MAVDLISRHGTAAYLPARYVKRLIDQGRLHLVPDAPIFPYPAWVIWREDLPRDLRQAAAETLHEIASSVAEEQDEVLEDLEEISQDEIDTLGNEDNA